VNLLQAIALARKIMAFVNEYGSVADEVMAVFAALVALVRQRDAAALTALIGKIEELVKAMESAEVAGTLPPKTTAPAGI
jgi:hypothetical protein